MKSLQRSTGIAPRVDALGGLGAWRSCARLSVRTLAAIAGCTERLVRQLEVVGHLPPELKQRIQAGEPTSKFVAWARAARIAAALCISNR